MCALPQLSQPGEIRTAALETYMFSGGRMSVLSKSDAKPQDVEKLQALNNFLANPSQMAKIHKAMWQERHAYITHVSEAT